MFLSAAGPAGGTDAPFPEFASSGLCDALARAETGHESQSARRGTCERDPVVRAARTNYHLGAMYALATAALLATQEPFSAMAAKRLPLLSFLCLTQFALLTSVPLLIAGSASRRDFSVLLSAPQNYGKLLLLFLIGVSGLLLYNLGLRNAHPIIVSAILNLLPFGLPWWRS